jgi:hypothetical protein
MALRPQALRWAGEYGAESPLWSSLDGTMVGVDELPIDEETRSRLTSWARRWEDLAAPAVLVDEPLPSAPELERLEAEAACLRQRLEAQLGPGWSVTTAG